MTDTPTHTFRLPARIRYGDWLLMPPCIVCGFALFAYPFPRLEWMAEILGVLLLVWGSSRLSQAAMRVTSVRVDEVGVKACTPLSCKRFPFADSFLSRVETSNRDFRLILRRANREVSLLASEWEGLPELLEERMHTADDAAADRESEARGLDEGLIFRHPPLLRLLFAVMFPFLLAGCGFMLMLCIRNLDHTAAALLFFLVLPVAAISVVGLYLAWTWMQTVVVSREALVHRRLGWRRTVRFANVERVAWESSWLGRTLIVRSPESTLRISNQLRGYGRLVKLILAHAPHEAVEPLESLPLVVQRNAANTGILALCVCGLALLLGASATHSASEGKWVSAVGVGVFALLCIAGWFAFLSLTPRKIAFERDTITVYSGLRRRQYPADDLYLVKLDVDQKNGTFDRSVNIALADQTLNVDESSYDIDAEELHRRLYAAYGDTLHRWTDPARLDAPADSARLD